MLNYRLTDKPIAQAMPGDVVGLRGGKSFFVVETINRINTYVNPVESNLVTMETIPRDSAQWFVAEVLAEVVMYANYRGDGLRPYEYASVEACDKNTARDRQALLKITRVDGKIVDVKLHSAP